MCKTDFLAHTEPLFKHLGILKLNDLLKMKALKFFYRYSNNQLPAYFENMFLAHSAVHMYNTRFRDVYHFAIPTRSSTQASVRFYVPDLIKSMPSNIIDKVYTHSYSGFSNYVKLQLVNQYSEFCTITNCYVCSRNL